MILAIVGTHTISESSQNYHRMKEAIGMVYKYQTIKEVVSGGAPGIDTMAKTFAEDLHIPMKVFSAEWRKYGKAAGPKRNTFIIDYCDSCIAFPDKNSKGTFDSIRKAKKQNKLKEVIFWEEIDKLLNEGLTHFI